MRDSYSPLLSRKAKGDSVCANRDRSLSAGGFDDRFSRFNGEVAIDDDSANSREALLEEVKPAYKRRFSNASQSSHELSDSERRKDGLDEREKKLDDPLNSGSIVGIDWLFENGDCAAEPWASKSEYRID